MKLSKLREKKGLGKKAGNVSVTYDTENVLLMDIQVVKYLNGSKWSELD